MDADAISREPFWDALHSCLEIGQRRAQTTFIIISLGVLQIVCKDTRQNRAIF